MAEAESVFFITGAGSGIGRVTSRFLLQRGYSVFLTDVSSRALEVTCTEHLPSILPSASLSRFKWQVMDVTRDEEVKAAVDACLKCFGRIDVLVNNAAINSQYFRAKIRMDAVPASDFEHVLAVNLTGPYRVSSYCVAPLTLSPGGGVIINLGSCRASQQQPNGEAYAASKAGLNGLTMAMAMSLGPKIRVHSLSPGMVDVRSEREPEQDEVSGEVDLTKQWKTHWRDEGKGVGEALKAAHPVGRLGKGEDVARWIEFLGVKEGGFTTGGEFMVDGGYSKVLSYPE